MKAGTLNNQYKFIKLFEVRLTMIDGLVVYALQDVLESESPEFEADSESSHNDTVLNSHTVGSQLNTQTQPDFPIQYFVVLARKLFCME
ncbi:hypothetical protein P3T76_011561 [Phytophthora citrophthora]|uniref:Uncharacterized protein n=1 Tax=Phytophthora citrophthora TaxID=4793 RepID=A0AAD9LEZ5_9STRA|nr:hypothetical protein P3T76_011561 [Phytophthora citrophthora]